MTIEIVDLPIKNGDLYMLNYQRVILVGQQVSLLRVIRSPPIDSGISCQ